MVAVIVICIVRVTPDNIATKFPEHFKTDTANEVAYPTFNGPSKLPAKNSSTTPTANPIAFGPSPITTMANKF